MASPSAQLDPTAHNPTSNGTSHESADLPNENGEHWSKGLVRGMDTMIEKMDDMQKDLLKLQDDVASLRKSFADSYLTLQRLTQLVPTEPVPPSDNSI